MDEDSFKYHLGLWRALNIDMESRSEVRFQTRYKLPLPPTARISPVSVLLWDDFKGGGDTITKLLDNCQERIGIGTENNVASARLLKYDGVLMHRFNQWGYAKEDLT